MKVSSCRIPLKKSVFELYGRCSLGAASGVDEGVLPAQAGIGGAAGTSVASFRRFWAVAARWNSSRAPFGPRNRSRSSFRMRLRCDPLLLVSATGLRLVPTQNLSYVDLVSVLALGSHLLPIGCGHAGWADFAPFRSPAFRVQFGVPLPLYEWRKSKGRIRREWWNTENEWSKPWVPNVRITPLGAITTLALQ